MFQEHTPPLALAYLAALGGWLLASFLLRGVWPRRAEERLERPWRELGFALLGVVGILLLGQLWLRGIRLPEQGPLGPLLGAINQALIFSPILLVLAVRRQPATSAWLPRPRLATRILVGLALACAAVAVYSLLRKGAAAPWVVLGRIWRYDHLDEMTQVFLEDVTLAVLFIRLSHAVGRRWATALAACLFAAAHIPAMLSQGATASEFAGLLRDVGVGVSVLLVLQRSRDIVWFWCVHFCLDMTQFARITGAG